MSTFTGRDWWWIPVVSAAVVFLGLLAIVMTIFLGKTHKRHRKELYMLRLLASGTESDVDMREYSNSEDFVPVETPPIEVDISRPETPLQDSNDVLNLDLMEVSMWEDAAEARTNAWTMGQMRTRYQLINDDFIDRSSQCATPLLPLVFFRSKPPVLHSTEARYLAEDGTELSYCAPLFGQEFESPCWQPLLQALETVPPAPVFTAHASSMPDARWTHSMHATDVIPPESETPVRAIECDHDPASPLRAEEHRGLAPYCGPPSRELYLSAVENPLDEGSWMLSNGYSAVETMAPFAATNASRQRIVGLEQSTPPLEESDDNTATIISHLMPLFPRGSRVILQPSNLNSPVSTRSASLPGNPINFVVEQAAMPLREEPVLMPEYAVQVVPSSEAAPQNWRGPQSSAFLRESATQQPTQANLVNSRPEPIDLSPTNLHVFCGGQSVHSNGLIHIWGAQVHYPKNLVSPVKRAPRRVPATHIPRQPSSNAGSHRVQPQNVDTGVSFPQSPLVERRTHESNLESRWTAPEAERSSHLPPAPSGSLMPQSEEQLRAIWAAQEASQDQPPLHPQRSYHALMDTAPSCHPTDSRLSPNLSKGDPVLFSCSHMSSAVPPSSYYAAPIVSMTEDSWQPSVVEPPPSHQSQSSQQHYQPLTGFQLPEPMLSFTSERVPESVPSKVVRAPPEPHHVFPSHQHDPANRSVSPSNMAHRTHVKDSSNVTTTFLSAPKEVPMMCGGQRISTDGTKMFWGIQSSYPPELQSLNIPGSLIAPVPPAVVHAEAARGTEGPVNFTDAPPNRIIPRPPPPSSKSLDRSAQLRRLQEEHKAAYELQLQEQLDLFSRQLKEQEALRRREMQQQGDYNMLQAKLQKEQEEAIRAMSREQDQALTGIQQQLQRLLRMQQETQSRGALGEERAMMQDARDRREAEAAAERSRAESLKKAARVETPASGGASQKHSFRFADRRSSELRSTAQLAALEDKVVRAGSFMARSHTSRSTVQAEVDALMEQLADVEAQKKRLELQALQHERDQKELLELHAVELTEVERLAVLKTKRDMMLQEAHDREERRHQKLLAQRAEDRQAARNRVEAIKAETERTKRQADALEAEQQRQGRKLAEELAAQKRLKVLRTQAHSGSQQVNAPEAEHRRWVGEHVNRTLIRNLREDIAKPTPQRQLASRPRSLSVQPSRSSPSVLEISSHYRGHIAWGPDSTPRQFAGIPEAPDNNSRSTERFRASSMDRFASPRSQRQPLHRSARASVPVLPTSARHHPPVQELPAEPLMDFSLRSGDVVARTSQRSSIPAPYAPKRFDGLLKRPEA